MRRKHLLESVEQFLAGSIGALRSRKRVEMTGFNLMYQFLWLAVRRNEIEPAPRYHEFFGEPQHAIGDRITVMVVVEQPRVEVTLAQGRLDGAKIHRIGYCTRRLRIRARSRSGRVSQAVRKTSRGAFPRILRRYRMVRAGFALAVSRNSQPNPFCTMSSWSSRSWLESRWISGQNFPLRVPYISATHAALRCQRRGDLLQSKTSCARSGCANTIGAIR